MGVTRGPDGSIQAETVIKSADAHRSAVSRSNAWQPGPSVIKVRVRSVPRWGMTAVTVRELCNDQANQKRYGHGIRCEFPQTRQYGMDFRASTFAINTPYRPPATHPAPYLLLFYPPYHLPPFFTPPSR